MCVECNRGVRGQYDIKERKGFCYQSNTKKMGTVHCFLQGNEK